MTEEKKILLDTISSEIFVALANVHTIVLARVTAVGEKTLSCRPLVARVVKGESIPLPEFVEVPLVVLQGGGSYTIYPVAVGDDCLLLVTERCFDRWWAGDAYVAPLEFRMHDYSDGFALVGVNASAGAITIPAVITQVGDTYQEGDYEHVGNRTQQGDFEQTGAHTLTGDSTVTGNSSVSGNVEAATYSVGGQAGASGVFISKDDKTVTVVNGLITGIV